LELSVEKLFLGRVGTKDCQEGRTAYALVFLKKKGKTLIRRLRGKGLDLGHADFGVNGVGGWGGKTGFGWGGLGARKALLKVGLPMEV